MGKLQRLLSLSVPQFIYYNFLCRRVKRDKGKYIIPNRYTRIELHKTGKIILHGNLYLNTNKYPHSRAECYLRLRDGAGLTVNGPVSLMYNGTIEVHKNAALHIGSCTVQTGAVIICAYKMTIGNGCLFSRMCCVSDSDHHRVMNREGESTNYPRKTVIGDNVWIGLKATVMKGAKIKSGSAVGANAVVGGKVREHSFLMNEPARVFSEIYWTKEGFGDWNHD